MPVKVIFHGHASVEIQSGKHVLQVDPYFDENPLSDIKADKASADFIFLTHAHGDHIGDAEPISRRTGAPIVACYEIASHFMKKGLQAFPMNHGGGKDFPFGHAYMTIAFHTSSFPDGSYGGQPAGWIIQTGGKTIYHAGDTALFGDMELIGRLYPIDLACLPIGDGFTMGPRDAMLAAKMLKAKHVLPLHYDTWPPIKQDAQAFARQLEKEHGIKGLPLKAGQSVEL